jgi:hypothetical protein
MAGHDSGKPSHAEGLTRRQAMESITAGLAAPMVLSHDDKPHAPNRPRIAAVVTEYRKKDHGQGIVDRFLEGYGWQGRHHRPALDIVSLYVDQTRPGDLSKDRASRHPELTIYPTIAQALTRGEQKLAVDGVLIIGEHGRYPRNERGQRLYPRYEFFQQVVDVFRRSGRSVPVFNDKHLSWRWDWAKEMVDTAHAIGFPFLAGSSLPVTWRIPAVELRWGAEVEEVVCVGYGGIDSYDIHGLETLQCMVERRKGGETGVAAVEARRGQAVWKALAAADWSRGGCSRELFEACLCRSFTLASPRPGYGNVFPELKDLPALVSDPVMYRIEYADGLKGTLLMLSGLVGDFTVALRVKDQQAPLSTQMYLPGLHPGQTLPNFFSALAQQIERLFLTGKPPYPVERTLLTTGILAAAIDSLAQGQKRLDTPHLRQVAYQSPRESTFMRS